MKAIQIVKPNELRVIDMEKPTIDAENNVLVKIRASGICGSDVGIYHGTNAAATYPRVIGHEIGHVAMEHTMNAYKYALYTSAAFDVIASTGNVAAALTDSVLGQLGQSMITARYSRKQETEADDFGYSFLKASGRNPWSMVSAFEKLLGASEGGTAVQSSVMEMFSSHPNTASRIERMTSKCEADGFTRPE